MTRPALLCAVLAALALPALAQPAHRFMDERYNAEMKAGAPPEGAPAARGTPRGPGSLTGVWFNAEAPNPMEEEPVRTAEGEPAPLQPWALRIMVGRAADEEDGHPYADTSSRCLPTGVPQMMLEPRMAGIRILEAPKSVTVLFEQNNNWRQILIGPRPRDDASPTYMGDSIGRWEGDAFVVETSNIDLDQDVQGFPHTDKLRIVERFRRVSPDRLELKVTIDDPGTFTRPWSLPRRTLKLNDGVTLAEQLCTNQRNAPDAEGHTGFQGPKTLQAPPD